MYDEKQDFLNHRKEIEGMTETLDAAGIRLLEDMAVLDLGAGLGMHAGFLSRAARRIYCADIIDYSSLYGGEFLKLVREKHERHGHAFPLDRISFHQTDAMDLLFRDSFFDSVLSLNSFEHIPNPQRALHEMIRVTKPGGHIFISTDPIWTADTGNHFSHRVPEPWAHLICSDEEFVKKMTANSATPEETDEYLTAMNRWRAADYARAMDEPVRKRRIDVLHHDSWSGVVDEKHLSHVNLRVLASHGYTERELMVRGLRWVLRKR